MRFVGLSALLIGALAGCATAPTETETAPPEAAPAPAPVSRLGEARVAVGEAQAAGYAVDDALVFLRQAEQASAQGDNAAADALAQKTLQALDARRAIDEARPVVAAAMNTAGALAADSAKILDAAEAALKAGDPVRASELAAQARRQADAAVVQKREEEARLAAEAEAAKYQVVAGDTLWSVAAKPEVYGDSRLWPLLLKTNRELLKDADLLRPGMILRIDRHPSEEEKAAAARHSRDREGWKVGPTEPIDRNYLKR